MVRGWKVVSSGDSLGRDLSEMDVGLADCEQRRDVEVRQESVQEDLVR